MAPSQSRHDGPPPPRMILLALIAAGLLVIAGGTAFYLAAGKGASRPADGVVLVTVNGDGCQPTDLAVPAGPSLFEIENASDRPIEWEILDGVLVVEERENILPGLRSRLGATLKAGVYDMTCGLLTNPRGKLTVTAVSTGPGTAAAAPVKAFIGPLSEYKVFLGLNAARLGERSSELAAAIAAGDLDGARKAYRAAREAYRHVEAVAGRFADLEASIDVTAAYLTGHEQDAAFVGFHRLEYGLWHAGSTAGLAPIADRLAVAAAALKDRLKSVKLQPSDLADLAVREARRLGEGPVLTGDSAYAGNDLVELAAALDGLAKPAGLLQPLVAERDARAAETLSSALAATRGELSRLAGPGAPPAYSTVTPDDRQALAKSFIALSEAFASINPTLGLETSP